MAKIYLFWYINDTFAIKLENLDIFITVLVYILYYLKYKLLFFMNSNKDIFDRALGRPAMMAFILLLGTYVTTGQLIPGIY